MEIGDAYGATITAFHEGGEAVEIIERDDGYIAAIEDLRPDLGAFDSVVMFGNNLSLLGGRAKGRRLLRGLHELTSDRGRIVGRSLRVSDTDDPVHLAVHERNRLRGRMSAGYAFASASDCSPPRGSTT